MPLCIWTLVVPFKWKNGDVLLNKKLRYIILTLRQHFSKFSETKIVLEYICERSKIEGLQNYNQSQSVKRASLWARDIVMLRVFHKHLGGRRSTASLFLGAPGTGDGGNQWQVGEESVSAHFNIPASAIVLHTPVPIPLAFIEKKGDTPS